MNTLKQMGIQQWRKRADSPSAATPPSVADADARMPVADTAQIAHKESIVGEELSAHKEHIARPQEIEQQEAAELQTSPDNQVSREISAATRPEPTLSWEGLIQDLTDPAVCPSCAASQPILGAGNQQADCMFIVSTPSSNDLQRQQLVSGRVGQLFDAILKAMSLDRDQVYLTSACKCVVPDDSASTRPCVKMVHKQLALVNPKVVVSFGQQAGQWVVKSNEMLPVLRLHTQKCHSTDIPVVVTHDLSQLLSQPSLKAEAWRDLKRALRLLND